MEINEKDYLKGFSQGYLLSKHDPEFLEKTPKSLSKSDYSSGLTAGQKQNEKELAVERIKQQQSQNRDRGLSR